MSIICLISEQTVTAITRDTAENSTVIKTQLGQVAYSQQFKVEVTVTGRILLKSPTRCSLTHYGRILVNKST